MRLNIAHKQCYNSVEILIGKCGFKAHLHRSFECGSLQRFTFKSERRKKMREKLLYSPADIEVVEIKAYDVIATSSPLNNSGNISGDTWS